LCYAIERKQVAETLRAMNQTLEIQVKENATQLDKVKQLNQFRSEFVSMLSHDFRSPLTTILLATGLLQNSEQKLTKEQKIAHFQHINSAIKNMAQLLDEVSLVGKADAGKLECQLAPLDVEKFCRQLVAEAQLSINAKHLTLAFTSQGTSGKVLCDEGLLRHILTNLLGNAIKYSPPSSTVRLESIAQARSLIFQIQDEGIGIPPEEQQLMFQPFHRASNVGTIPGTGLGLAIVKKCVEACNGQILLKSEVGVGTTFTVTLPLIEVAV
jgi:signal transduction histidine kinase